MGFFTVYHLFTLSWLGVMAGLGLIYLREPRGISKNLEILCIWLSRVIFATLTRKFNFIFFVLPVKVKWLGLFLGQLWHLMSQLHQW